MPRTSTAPDAPPATPAALRPLGILGGMSWESTLVYYRLINQGVAARRGGLHSAPLWLHSSDFETIAARQRAGDWDGAAAQLGAAGLALRQAGAQGLLIATNTMHRIAAPVQAAAGLPLLHIGDATAQVLNAAGQRRVALLGTAFTMEQPFLREHLAACGIETLVPDAATRAELHRIIFEELCRGILRDDARATYQRAIGALAAQGAQAALLACTEIGLLLPPGTPAALPLVDTTTVHAEAAVRWICGDDTVITR